MKYDEFYALPERAASEEVPLGDRWRDDGRGPWKVTWIEATGEVAAFLFGPDPAPTFLDVASVDPLGGIVLGAIGLALDHHRERRLPGPVEVLGRVGDREQLRTVLTGWPEQEESVDGIAWLRERLADNR